jgi:hypothetical protein
MGCLSTFYTFYGKKQLDYDGSAIKLYAAYEICLRKALCYITRVLGRKKE